MKYLLGQGFRVFPINPGQAGKELLGQTVYASLADIPEPIDMIDIFRRSEAADGIVDEALALDPRPRVIWMQLGVRNDAAAAKAEAAGMTVIMNRCPKIEFGRLCGEIGWFGVNSGRISSRPRKPRRELPAYANFRRRIDSSRRTGREKEIPRAGDLTTVSRVWFSSFSPLRIWRNSQGPAVPDDGGRRR